MNAKEKLADYQRQFGVYAEANSEVMGAFGATVTAAMENSGSLDAKTMELLILVAAVSRKCEPCIYSHVMNYINAGGTKDATYSPEYGSAEDCNFDLSLLRWGCLTLIQSAERLKIDDPLLPKWKTVLEELTPYPMDENGLFIGRNTPYAFSHRHYSHLLAAYPLYTLNKEHPEDVDLIERSLHFWQSKTGAHQGYSLTGASSISSALGKGNDALAYLNKLFGRFLSVNTLYRESGPVIETPLSGAQSIHDMLLQSWGGKIRVFPAVPDAWQDVAFDADGRYGTMPLPRRRCPRSCRACPPHSPTPGR